MTTINLDYAEKYDKARVDKFLQAKGIKTRNHLISGAPTSQVLSYLVNYPMFSEIQRLCDANGISVSVYVDDLAFSSDKSISYQFKAAVERITKKHFYRQSRGKSKTYTKGYRKEVTGVIIAADGTTTLTNSLRYKIIKEFEHLRSNTDDEISRKRLMGLLTAAWQVNSNAFPSIYRFVIEHK